MAAETGKERARRIPLDYFKQADPLQTWKTRLGVLGLLLPIIWVGGAAGFRSDGGTMMYSRGPVAHVHAMYDLHCNACHVPFKPVDDHHWASGIFGIGPTTTSQCIKCHSGEVHHQGQKPDISCAACHREHLGRDASLTRLPDSDCTQCHANLSAHGGGQTFKNLTSFHGNHPEFRSIKADPGKLKFNHWVHMEKGMNVGFKYNQIPKSERHRYYKGEGSPEDAPVQLDCQACHQVDSGDFKSQKGLLLAELGSRTVGAYMQPITYENQCQACHPLTLPGKEKTVSIPHGLQPTEVHDFLWGAIAHERIQFRFPDWKTPPLRPLPGKEIKDILAKEGEIKKEILDNVSQVEKFLFKDVLEKADKFALGGRQTCGECHHYQNAKGEPTGYTGDFNIRVVRPEVPTIWFQHGLFNHRSHRAVDCKACHDKAAMSKTSKDVLIPGKDNCVQCHAPQKIQNGKWMGGARFDCTECHLYHHRTSPEYYRQGIGAEKRGPLPKAFPSIENFLAP